MATRFLKIVLLLFLCGMAHAYTVVQISTGAPPGTEQSFLASTTNQFQAKLVPNPLASNTYSMTLYGPNPNYIAPGQTAPSLPCHLDQDVSLMVQNSTMTGVYMFASGMVYQNKVAEGIAVGLGNLCGSATSFNLIESSTKTFDKGTCMDTINTLLGQFFELDLSTPTPIPPEP